MKNFKKTSVMFDVENYKLFKQICKVNNSDASKTLRAFIEDYISKNQLLEDMDIQEQKARRDSKDETLFKKKKED